LLVDDEDDLRSMVTRLLTREGYNVLEASGGNEAAMVYAQHQHEPDLVIADLIMPDREGLDLIKMLRRTYEHVKIIAITGAGREGKTSYLFIAREPGADCTIEKPFSAEHLLSAVRLALETEPALPVSPLSKE
jgi:DNA-binding response OmpR family regulator